MARAYLGRGWAFPVAVSNGAVAEAAHDESVRQSILIILGTAKGERVMRPEFGCGIHDLVFERNTPATAGKVSAAVREALLSFEPRADVTNVQVEAQDSGSVLQISIDYQVRATNNAFNLVFPFYLQQGAGQ
jgi:phage baseplate assembly protein W